ncbi:MAG: hypothetical protein ACU85V_04910 [Gammaproteobacteria bacterium]
MQKLIALTTSLALLLVATPATARMYQWLDPQTGRVQLSGGPPAWYRGLATGPRVLVFDDGELVDDTAITVPEAQRERLRSEAFAGSGSEAPAPSTAEVGRSELKAAMVQARELGIDVDAVAEELDEEAAAAAGADAAEDLAERVAALKSLIEAYDQQQLDQARAVIRGLPPAAAETGRY